MFLKATIIIILRLITFDMICVYNFKILKSPIRMRYANKISVVSTKCTVDNIMLSFHIKPKYFLINETHKVPDWNRIGNNKPETKHLYEMKNSNTLWYDEICLIYSIILVHTNWKFSKEYD